MPIGNRYATRKLHAESKQANVKREGYIYDRMAEWDLIVEAECNSTKRKSNNYGVKQHVLHRMKNLCEIQQNVLNDTMRTGEYRHEALVSGQDKLRDISKLHFHPNHIQLQLLVLAAEERAEKALIYHTYASRKGKGQIKAALRLKRFISEHDDAVWYCQMDICKYYANILHALLRDNLLHIFKDVHFVDAFLEPFKKFAPDGKGAPLGIHPSQLAGNVCLMRFDRFATEIVQCWGYLRYLDDFVFFGKTKGEVKRKCKRLVKYLRSIGFAVHEPKIHRVAEGLNMLGYIYHGRDDDMFWRRKNKARWLRHRSRLRNAKRIRELDDAAWGMLKWGNHHCKRLFALKTGQLRDSYNMGIKLNNSGMHITQRVDEFGNPFIEAPLTSMPMVLDKRIVVRKVVSGIKTGHGDGRMALEIELMGGVYKLIVNAANIKQLCEDMKRNNVSRFATVFVDKGGRRYDVNLDQTEILAVGGRDIEADADGNPVFADNKEKVMFNV